MVVVVWSADVDVDGGDVGVEVLQSKMKFMARDVQSRARAECREERGGSSRREI